MPRTRANGTESSQDLPVSCGLQALSIALGRQSAIVEAGRRRRCFLDRRPLRAGLEGVGVFSEAHGAACVRFRCGLPRDAEGVARYRLWTTRTAIGCSYVVLGGFLHRETVCFYGSFWSVGSQR